jgi:hypothetical protein
MSTQPKASPNYRRSSNFPHLADPGSTSSARNLDLTSFKNCGRVADNPDGILTLPRTLFPAGLSEVMLNVIVTDDNSIKHTCLEVLLVCR